MIKKVFKTENSNRRAIRIPVVMGILLLTSCFLTACQPTPENDIVINKGDGRLDETIHNTKQPSTGSNIISQDTWVEDVSNNDGDLFIKINADLPSTSNLPVIKIRPGSFTQEQVDSILAYFSQGNPVYPGDAPLTKDEIAERIIELESEYTRFKNGDDGFDEHTTVESFDQQLEAYREMYASAPDAHEYERADTALTTDPETMQAGVDLKIDMGGDDLARFTVTNQGPNDYSSAVSFYNGEKYDDRRALYGEDAKGLKTTIDQAQEQAQNVIRDLGLGDYHVVDVLTGVSINNPDKQGYIVVCTPVIHSVPITYSIMANIADPNIIEATDGSGRLVYADTGQTVEYVPRRWDECSIEIHIDDTGITSFVWKNLCDIISIENEKVSILDFDEIKRIFLQQMKSNFIVNNKENGVVYHVERIELGLVTIPRKDNIGEFLLVPGWTFYGNSRNPDGADNMMNDNSIYASHLTLNAIDGSVLSD